MLRINRSRFIGIACLVIFIYFLVFTDSGSSSSSDFRTSTEASLARIRSKQKNQLPLRGDLSDEDLTKKTYEELQEILRKKNGNENDDVGERGGAPPVHEVKQVKVSTEEEDPVAASRNAMQSSGSVGLDQRVKTYTQDRLSKEEIETEVESTGDPGKDFAREKLMIYLKSPVVIFSKSYCPHSKRAKQLLLEIYKIVPEPIVVELDMMGEKLPQAPDTVHDEQPPPITLGKALQDLLGETTGRKTVPNIVVGGSHSIGGNDKIWELHEAGLLAEEIKKLGGRKVVSVDVRDSEDDGQR